MAVDREGERVLMLSWAKTVACLAVILVEIAGMSYHRGLRSGRIAGYKSGLDDGFEAINSMRKHGAYLCPDGKYRSKEEITREIEE
jgi:hypothetical protein